MGYWSDWNRIPECERVNGDPESLRTSPIEAVLRVEIYRMPHGTLDYWVRCLLENGEVVEVRREDVENLGPGKVPEYNKRLIEDLINRPNPKVHLPPLT